MSKKITLTREQIEALGPTEALESEFLTVTGGPPLCAFYFRTPPRGGEDGRHILVWGRLQDAQVRQTTFMEHASQTGALKVPVVCDGALAWVAPARLTLLEDGGAQPPEAWVKLYYERIKK